MSKAMVEILTPALNDIDKIADYHLLAVGPISAEKITDKLLNSIEKLGEYPLLGTEHSDPVLQKRGYRKLVCGEYICVYRLIDDAIYVYRVVHSATDYPKFFR
ncbi:MAG: type II toxin-antitoxin system RelE/ParE family toxin [Clostridia bacterium]|nr:type II toxin-antitoxin system RelE/ParE family toxin [Clostridia bacterium]MDD4048015.1 type II toxin-antitoxin system RelE/ParE family toxin [Clostridia bacterium]